MKAMTNMTLLEYLTAVKEGSRRFEKVFQSLSRMILENRIEKTVVNGRNTNDFQIFRQRAKHGVGMFDEINSFASFVQDAAEGGSSKRWPLYWWENPVNEEKQKLYDRMIDTMLNKLHYCETCAQKTIEYFCTQEDEA